jgi:hypothetical protein
MLQNLVKSKREKHLKKIEEDTKHLIGLSKNYTSIWNRKSPEKAEASRTNSCRKIHKNKVRITKAGNEMQLSKAK